MEYTPVDVCADWSACMFAYKEHLLNAFLFIWSRELNAQQQTQDYAGRGIHPTWSQPSRKPALSNSVAAPSSLVSIFSDGWMELGGLHSPRSADCCGLLPWQCIGGVCGVYWHTGFLAGANFLLPRFPGSGWLFSGCGRCAPGCSTGWLGDCDPWPVPTF